MASVKSAAEDGIIIGFIRKAPEENTKGLPLTAEIAKSMWICFNTLPKKFQNPADSVTRKRIKNPFGGVSEGFSFYAGKISFAPNFSCGR